MTFATCSLTSLRMGDIKSSIIRMKKKPKISKKMSQTLSAWYRGRWKRTCWGPLFRI